ncbi:hypothetical protein HK405_013174, partial [Cladochytrium tenue]
MTALRRQFNSGRVPSPTSSHGSDASHDAASDDSSPIRSPISSSDPALPCDAMTQLLKQHPDSPSARLQDAEPAPAENVLAWMATLPSPNQSTALEDSMPIQRELPWELRFHPVTISSRKRPWKLPLPLPDFSNGEPNMTPNDHVSDQNCGSPSRKRAADGSHHAGTTPSSDYHASDADPGPPAKKRGTTPCPAARLAEVSATKPTTANHTAGAVHNGRANSVASSSQPTGDGDPGVDGAADEAGNDHDGDASDDNEAGGAAEEDAPDGEDLVDDRAEDLVYDRRGEEQSASYHDKVSVWLRAVETEQFE